MGGKQILSSMMLNRDLCKTVQMDTVCRGIARGYGPESLDIQVKHELLYVAHTPAKCEDLSEAGKADESEASWYM